jgi:uncharacterized protein (TIGR01777 family)
MSSETFVRRTRLDVPAHAAFDWHARPGALERLTPPWNNVRVLERHGGIENGGRVVLSMPLGPTRVRWVAEHDEYVPGKQFRDTQVEGPFKRWVHTHRFEPDGETASFLEDHIEYELPLGSVGALVGGGKVRSMLASMFAYRHRLTAGDLAAHAAHGGEPLHVAVTGASGLIGSTLVPFLTTGRHRVTRLVRSAATATSDTARWDPATGQLDTARLGDCDAVVHLAGENIMSGRWTAESKARIKDSRVRATRLLCESLARLQPRPRVLVSASAIGFYGNRGDQELDEHSAPGTGFLAELCQEWERATAPAADAGIRVVMPRIGLVMTPAGGVLAKLLTPFRLGAGGVVGDGRHYMSWIAMDDMLGIILHALRSTTLQGPINAVAPAPVTNREFTKTLAGVLSRPTLLPIPAPAARLVFGEMADEALLASARILPRRARETGYVFRWPELDGALRHLLGKLS